MVKQGKQGQQSFRAKIMEVTETISVLKIDHNVSSSETPSFQIYSTPNPPHTNFKSVSENYLPHGFVHIFMFAFLLGM